MCMFVYFRRVKTPMGTSDRDFVMNLTHGPNQDGGYYVLYKNTTHPSKPEIPGVVRLVYCSLDVN